MSSDYLIFVVCVLILGIALVALFVWSMKRDLRLYRNSGKSSAPEQKEVISDAKMEPIPMVDTKNVDLGQIASEPRLDTPESYFSIGRLTFLFGLLLWCGLTLGLIALVVEVGGGPRGVNQIFGLSMAVGLAPLIYLRLSSLGCLFALIFAATPLVFALCYVAIDPYDPMFNVFRTGIRISLPLLVIGILCGLTLGAPNSDDGGSEKGS